jgi:hypothetical protein
MSETAFIHPDLAAEPVRRDSTDKKNRLDFTGNFHRVVEFTSAAAAPQNARRGK